MQHVKEQNWFAVGLDVVVVIVGIFLGLQVAEWNESRKESDSEREYLLLITNDLDEIINHANLQHEFEQSRIRYSAELITILEQEQQLEKQERVGRLLTLLSIRRTPNFSNSAFDDLKSSGKLSLIGNSELRQSIIDFYNRIERWERIVDKNNELFIDTGFTRWLIEAGIYHSPIRTTSKDEYKEVFEDENYQAIFAEEKITPDMRSPGDPFLEVPLGDETWNQIRQKVSWRVNLAAINYRGALVLIDRTNDLKNRIQQQLQSD